MSLPVSASQRLITGFALPGLSSPLHVITVRPSGVKPWSQLRTGPIRHKGLIGQHQTAAAARTPARNAKILRAFSIARRLLMNLESASHLHGRREREALANQSPVPA